MLKTQRLILTHHLHAVFLLTLLITGLSLLISPMRAQMNEWNIPVVSIHIWVALLYTLLIISQALYICLRYPKKRPPIKKFNIWFNMLLFSSWVVSGTMMYFHHYVSASLRNTAVIIHDYSTWIIIPWALTHMIGHAVNLNLPWPKWWKYNEKPPEWIRENNLERRDFLKSLITLIAFLFLGGIIKWFLPVLSVAGNEVKRRGYFRIYNVTNEYPKYVENNWSLTIDGLVNQPLTVSLKDLRALKWETIVDDFHCVTGWSVRNVEMRGVTIKNLFEHFNIHPQGTYVTAFSGDEIYFETYKLSQLVDENAMLVFEMDGLPLKQIQGFPCRLYHPDMYGYKSLKWLTKMTIEEKRDLGYWQQSGGYDLDGYL
ncbi:molybdopterin-dependent oxidoreductase [Bacillus sp. Marseille-P3661]|uniref:molybdopterin-dependent oxidoreductase n=1 Tax=Bacillus sp. Marseille-P3661 TaxID=1936234 RepID=UPI000C83D6C8|nr:molybdopterin-dependent oxidoreductase [Bacillus sp. Marseille-P3661]